MISKRLTEDMKTALKAGDKFRLSVIRMLRSELKNAEIEAGKTLEDAEEEKVLTSYARKRKEAMEQYFEGGREDLAEKERKEHDITVSYLPPRLDTEQLTAMVRKTVGDEGAGGMKDFGRIMKAVMQAVGGRADGSTVSDVVKKVLGE
jgi:uncharacterized protein YqeY